MKYVSNAFSLAMLKEDCNLSVEEISEEVFDNVKDDCISCVGHEDTANILEVSFNRISVSLEKGDVLYVAQLTGGRLPEGATELPDGFKFKFLKVKIEEDGRSFYIDRDDSFLVVKKYFDGNFSRTYIPISSIIDVKIMSFKE